MAIIQVLRPESQRKQLTPDESEQPQTGFDTHPEQGIPRTFWNLLHRVVHCFLKIQYIAGYKNQDQILSSRYINNLLEMHKGKAHGLGGNRQQQKVKQETVCKLQLATVEVIVA